MSGNSLQAMLNRAKANSDAPESDAEKATPPPPTPRSRTRTTEGKKAGRSGTRLIGGHFAPEVATQLRILAAEEGSTIQSLLAEALDDLFVKKGKGRIKRP